MLSRTLLKNPTLLAKNARTFGATVNPHSYLQKPGTTKNSTVTLLPGYFIGPEVTSKF
jgi:hypothetical protein